MSIEQTIRRGTAPAWRIAAYWLFGEPASPEAYTPATGGGPFIPISLELPMAPDVPRLRFGVAPNALAMPWMWPRQIRLDSMVDLYCDQAGEAAGMFSGFVVEPDWNYQASGGDCTFVAMGRSQRLLADVPVYGRYMWDANKADRFCSGLPLEFNVGGQPNRGADRGSGGSSYPFTWEGDPKAEYWTAVEAIEYLAQRYNPEATWLSNPVLTDAQRADNQSISISVEGQSLWEAMANVAAQGGYDLWESFITGATGAAGGRVSSAIRLQHRHAGSTREVSHQVYTSPMTAVNITKTNSFSARVAESVASCITAPILLGARHLTEVAIELFPCWPADSLTYDANADGPMILENEELTGYAQKYCIGGPEFHEHRFAGRRWDAGTDGDKGLYADYIDTPTDMGLLIDGEAGSWPAMAHKARPLLNRLGYGADVVAYWTPDGSSTYPLKGFRVDPERIGIYIHQANLADIQYGDKEDKATQNLFYALVNSHATVHVYLICTIASIDRSEHKAVRRVSAGTAFTTRRIFDRGAAGGLREVSGKVADPPSPWYGTVSMAGGEVGLADVTVDDRDELKVIAAAVQDSAEDRYIEAALEIPWPETSWSLGDRITRISGIGYPLGTNGGAATRFPRIVRMTLNLTPDTYDTQVMLDTDRQAGVV